MMFKWFKNPLYVSVFFIAVCANQLGAAVANGQWFWALLFSIATVFNTHSLVKIVNEDEELAD